MVALRFRIILLIAALLAFGGALWAPFQFDDFSLLTDAVMDSSDGWRQAFTLIQTRPLTYLTFWANLQASDAPWGFHLVSLLTHLLCVWLAWEVVRELLPERAAMVAAALFAVHPLQTEAVVYVFARATLLSAALSLLALRLWLKGRLWAAVGAFGVALLAKEEVAALPLLVALLEWGTRRRRAAAGPIAAMAGLSAAAGLRAVYAVGAVAGSGAGAQAGITPFDYFSYQGVAMLRYLWLLLAPLGLTVDAEVRVAPLAASLAWGVIAVVAVLSWRTVRAAQAGFWILGGLLLLLPSSSVFPAADLAADRRMYLPMLCFCGLLGLVLQKADWRLLSGYAVVLTALSVAQTMVWQSPQSLWMEASRRAPEKVRPKRQLARVLPAEQAVELLEQARRQAPEDVGVAMDYGVVLLRAGRPELALSEFGRALALEPGSATAIHNRGLALLAMGQPEAAEGDFRRALERDPCLFDALINLRRVGKAAAAPKGCQWTRAQREALLSSER
ncbi:MAG: tetratricopeptide repeat protein [Acidobacteria bacterium]|nr:tetratricopeptide repeat protein [Acidobacteriota bacterium]